MRKHALLVALLCGCSKPAPTTPQPKPPVTEVRAFGTLRALVHEGKTGAQVQMANLVPGPHTYGVGALSELRGEVTVLDDVVWLAYPNEDGTARVQRETATNEGAALFVSARVQNWTSQAIEEDVSFDTVDERIAKMAEKSGLDTDRPFPVLIEGTFADLAWHVIDGKRARATGSHEDHQGAAVKGVLTEASGTLVGFFSRHHHGVFTHMGQNTHFHAVLPARSITGHVDRVGVRAGSVIRFPRDAS